jgi:hypothetical protein
MLTFFVLSHAISLAYCGSKRGIDFLYLRIHWDQSLYQLPYDLLFLLDKQNLTKILLILPWLLWAELVPQNSHGEA